MAKFCGPIGYGLRVETRRGVWTDEFVERTSYGDIERATTHWNESSDSTNDDLNINVQISIVADPFAQDNLRSMKYVRLMGANWKITKVEPRYPRLILTLGGVYNGPIAQT